MTEEDKREEDPGRDGKMPGAEDMGLGAEAAGKAAEIAVRAAAGDTAGAVSEAVKNPGAASGLVKAILISLTALILVVVIFLYALPVSIYETLASFAERLEYETYAGANDTGTILSSVVAMIDLAGSYLWEGFKSLIGGLLSLVGISTDLGSYEQYGLYITFDGESETRTLTDLIERTIEKCAARQEQIAEAVEDRKGVVRRTALDYINSRRTHRIDCFYFTLTVNSVCWDTSGDLLGSPDMEDAVAAAVNLLSLYTVQTGASLSGMEYADFMKWLGYRPNIASGRTSFVIMSDNEGEYLAEAEVVTWEGTFMPQAYMDQRKEEKAFFGEEVTDFSIYQCSLLDRLITVTYTPLEDVYDSALFDWEWEDPDDPDNYNKIYYCWAEAEVTISLNTDILTLAEIADLWDGALPGGY